ncbi:MAG: hypothetical protein K0U54_01215 [Bacteroidetes bacterium]|nr:hypothetical protein [Bacteroidota bacterium]
MSNSNELLPLILTGYKDENFLTKVSEKPDEYKVMINPESIKWSRKIDYSEEEVEPGSMAPSQPYKDTPNDVLSFDIVIDCTGIVDSDRLDMKTEIANLESVVFTYNGEIHRPNYVKIQWGDNLMFNSVLKTFDTTYTLFKPDGSPLRAKISLSFGEYISPSNVKKEEGDESPDVSHLVTTTHGDTLPQLCVNVWNDPTYYVQVAKYNSLNKFRNLDPGEQLVFPPIIQPTS